MTDEQRAQVVRMRHGLRMGFLTRGLEAQTVICARRPVDFPALLEMAAHGVGIQMSLGRVDTMRPQEVMVAAVEAGLDDGADPWWEALESSGETIYIGAAGLTWSDLGTPLKPYLGGSRPGPPVEATWTRPDGGDPWEGVDPAAYMRGLCLPEEE